MKVVVAQIGARRHYAVPSALQRAGQLQAFATDWCAQRGLGRLAASTIPNFIARGPLARIGDRRAPDVPSAKIKTLDLFVLAEAAGRMRRRTADQYSLWAEANRRFGDAVVRLGFGAADTVYGFNAAAVEIFRAARQQGLKTVLDQTMAPWQYVETLLARERQRWPDWESPQQSEKWRELAARESEEWELSDTIICGSPFVIDSLESTGAETCNCRVVPYGYDLADQATPISRRSKRPLRVLFLGTVELRKGVPYLLEAARRLGRAGVEFRIVGPVRVQEPAVRQLRQHLDVIGPVARSEVHAHYRWADVFILPTLAEGSANVCYEAMSHGLPVITTPNAGSVVCDQVDGFLVNACDADGLADRITRLLDDEDERRSMARSAKQRAGEFSWTHYYEQLPREIELGLSQSRTDLKPSEQAL